jgi:hypothetical protein
VRDSAVAADREADAKPALSIVVPQAQATTIVTLMAPHCNDEAVVKGATALTKDGVMCVTWPGAQARGRIYCRTDGNAGGFKRDGVAGDGILLVTDDSRTKKVAALLAARSTNIAIDGKPYLATSGAVNYALHRQADSLTVELDLPINHGPAPARIKLGGLEPRAACRVALDGEPTRNMNAGNDGTVDLDVNLNHRRTVTITPAK